MEFPCMWQTGSIPLSVAPCSGWHKKKMCWLNDPTTAQSFDLSVLLVVLPQLYWMELRPIVPTGITAAQLLGKTRPMFDKKFKKRRNTLQNKGCCTQILSTLDSSQQHGCNGSIGSNAASFFFGCVACMTQLTQKVKIEWEHDGSHSEAASALPNKATACTTPTVPGVGNARHGKRAMVKKKGTDCSTQATKPEVLLLLVRFIDNLTGTASVENGISIQHDSYLHWFRTLMLHLLQKTGGTRTQGQRNAASVESRISIQHGSYLHGSCIFCRNSKRSESKSAMWTRTQSQRNDQNSSWLRV